MITYIGLGSNLNNPTEQLETAVIALQQLPLSDNFVCSSFYSTKPWGFVEQPDFVNAVVKFNTQLSPLMLLEHLHRIENQQGRVRSTEKNGPRTLDLDILLYGDLIINQPSLVIPHPRMMERDFVLHPLAEISPNLVLHLMNKP